MIIGCEMGGGDKERETLEFLLIKWVSDYQNLSRIRFISMRKKRGGRTIFVLFWVVGSIFWVMIGSISGDFIESLIHIVFGWALLYLIFFLLDLRKNTDG